MRSSRPFHSRPISLLLGALLFAGGVAVPHSHDVLSDHSAHSPLPEFSGGHSQPDDSRHIEAATRIDDSGCLACLYRQLNRSTAPFSASSGSLEPDRGASQIASDRNGLTGFGRLPATRAPPQA